MRWSLTSGYGAFRAIATRVAGYADRSIAKVMYSGDDGRRSSYRETLIRESARSVSRILAHGVPVQSWFRKIV